MTRVLMLGLGYGFLGLGFLGLFLPFLQGFLFLAIGLIILGRHAAWAERLLSRIKERYPRAGDMFTRAEVMSERWVHAVARRFRRS
jgi:uncharacterized membrane protein YbaN (DUF454 family)